MVTIEKKQGLMSLEWPESIIEILQSLPGFLGLTFSQYDKLARISTLIQIRAGEKVFLEGEDSDNLFVLLSGNVKLESYVPSLGPVEMYTAEPLDFFGWSSITSNVHQRTTSATALLDCNILSIDGKSLKFLCEEDHHIGYLIMRRTLNILANRMLSTRLQLYDAIVKILIEEPED